MKKILALVCSFTLLAGLVSGCSSQKNAASSGDTASSGAGNAKKLSIVCTIFPEYDWVRQILGDEADHAEVTMLLDNGVDLHSYQPSVDDIIKVSTCDLFIYVGGESDAWVNDALKEATNKNMVVINLLDVLGDTVKEEEVKEGMQAESEEPAQAETASSQNQEEGPEYDEHVWLSLKNTKVLCAYIADQLAGIDAAHADLYKANGVAYGKQLDALDQAYQAAVDSGKFHTLLFGDRFPFRYLVDDYGLDYYAAFVGCSAETEASFETIAFLAGKVDELGLTSVMTIEGAQHKIAQTIVENTAEKNQAILTLNSMQSVTSKDVEAGETYLSMMQGNLDVLKTALN
ncbi:MAG: metal ABC transporter substrate-binding protein [Lawsonibacter sp.]|nr:metal ABC transporter substrate-binding protein [Lawsonibacter sp.]